jgi:ribosomal protein S18 acetylase RimI-like enzyme
MGSSTSVGRTRRNAAIRDPISLGANHLWVAVDRSGAWSGSGERRKTRTRQDGSWFCYVIEDGHGELVGFAKGKRHDGGVLGYAGELNKIYLLRRVQRQGLGRRLLCAVARRFMEGGVASMLLFGEASNPSNGFYEAFGAERLYSDSGEFHGGYGWRDLGALVERCGE